MPALFGSWRPWLFAAVLVAVAFGLRWPGIERKVWNLDEGSTLTMAEIVRHGGVLYRDAADNRTPLVPYLKAAVLAVAGDWNMRAVHLVLAAMVGLTAVGIWRTLRTAGEERTGAWGAVYFLLLGFVMPGPVDVMTAHTGWFLVFFSAWAMWAFLQAWQRGSFRWGAVAGVLFALAALSKQPALLDWGACLVICALAVQADPPRTRPTLRVAGGLAAGWALTLAATWIYFAANNAWDDFVRYAWEYNTRIYVPEVPLAQRLWAIRVPFVQLWHSAPLALFLGAAAATWLLARAFGGLVRRAQPFALAEWLVLGWAASGLASTMLSGRDFDHYTIQAMPGLALACGWITARLIANSAAWSRPARRALLVALILVPASIAAVAVHRARHLNADDEPAIKIGALIREATSPEDRIFVWGYAPELHLFAERLPNTRFVYAVFLTGLVPWTNLDPLKNTDYAIVPGAWDAFWSDFEARRPAIIVDTRSIRGFGKYPLRKQARLHSIVERDYAELDAEVTSPLGFGVYKRVSRPTTPPPPVVLDGAVALQMPRTSPGDTPRLVASVPAGTRTVDLLVDGRSYRRLENPGPAAATVTFSLLPDEVPPGTHQLQVVARGESGAHATGRTMNIASPSSNGQSGAVGPALMFPDGTRIEPEEATTINDDHMAYREDRAIWDAHAPSRLVYRRRPELVDVEFSFGIHEEAYQRESEQRTDGIAVVVLFEDERGRTTQLYHRELFPATNSNDQGLQTGRVTLPNTEPGRLILLITAGRLSNPAFDWVYWKELRGRRLDIALHRGTHWDMPVGQDAPYGITPIEQGTERVTMVHAPSRLTYKAPPTGGRLHGRFGMLDASWSGQGRSEGAVFELRLTSAGAAPLTLWERTLRPFTEAADRGIHEFSVTLPPTRDGAELELVTRPANPKNNAFNYTFWQQLSIDSIAPAR